jgi:hypothetical protein
VKAIRLDELQKGDLIVVTWDDASDVKGTIGEHEANPCLTCKDWGVYLGVSGDKRKFIIVGKDVVQVQNEWGATRIPLELVQSITLVLSREYMIGFISEIQVLGRRIKLRKYTREVRHRDW